MTEEYYERKYDEMLQKTIDEYDVNVTEFIKQYKNLFRRSIETGHLLPSIFRTLRGVVPSQYRPSSDEIKIWRDNRSPQAIKRGEQMLLDIRLNPKSPIQELDNFFEEFPEFKIIIQE